MCALHDQVVFVGEIHKTSLGEIRSAGFRFGVH